MRASVVVLLCCLAGVLGGGALIGRWALGLAIIADSVAVAVFTLRWDDGTPAAPDLRDLEPNAWAVAGSVSSVLDRYKAAS